METVKTEKGTVLPLVNLKGKSYLMVGHRLQWLSEKYEHYTVNTNFHLITEEQTICTATVTLFDKEGKVIRQAQATKRETKKDFSDHTEKAETSAIGRALAILGLGTQHALSDLDEGERLADSPLPAVPKIAKPETVVNVTSKASSETVAVDVAKVEPLKKSSFRKPNVKKVEESAAASSSTLPEGWQ